MSDNIIVKGIAGTCITFSFILAGNAITQSFMTVPALLVDFPAANSPSHKDRARLLGRQWPLCWTVGNQFFRPISTLGFLGYAYSGYAVYSEGALARSDWKLFGVAAIMHLTTILHSALNMQPLNDKLEALAGRANDKELVEAETVARKWASWNRLRLVTPTIAGGLALWNLLSL
ncbi:hypothetical protein P153DRAFT_300633 [Dothidotthia symphoricarpi CBS 119687]|uniref:DUF1772-domain-containing protein n=1 Tax=Dothidotthia symphoricarpi CBS 119687 TaxID=1392245 RepID=A0A6A6A2U1_9PLEO|nr:uncharacterized protein P153DRAFT_300633 [Dothidotthia symphoricarpi CBS 119687]KAF2125058.1 hypothetical protein P153DRAFT_300633 [Dothidotthia symphoricarpi CBS 119687]